MNHASKLCLWAAAHVAIAAAHGTTAADDHGVSDAAVPDAGATAPGVPLDLDVPNPEGSYTASVRFHGTGCARATSDAQLSDDGKTFRFDLPVMTASIPEGSPYSSRDCTLVITIRSAERRLYTVTSFQFAGAGRLAAGAQLLLDGTWYASGIPSLATPEARTRIEGPFDDDFMVVRETPLEDRRYVPCSTERILYVPLRLTLRALRSSAEGAAKLGSATGKDALQLGIAWKACE